MTERAVRDCTHPRARHEHGTRAGYRFDACRCLPCRVAHNLASAAYWRGGSWREIEDTWVSSVGTARRLQGLAALGYTALEIASVSTLGVSQVQNLRRGQRPKVTAPTAAAVLSAYERLSATRATGREATRQRTSAARLGYVTPLAWDDETIDDPAAAPCGSVRVPVRGAELDEVLVERFMAGDGPEATCAEWAERVEAVRRLYGRGVGVTAIAARLRMTFAAVDQTLHRHGIRSAA